MTGTGKPYKEYMIERPNEGQKEGLDCPFHKRLGIECDDGYCACTIVQRLKEEVIDDDE